MNRIVLTVAPVNDVQRKRLIAAAPPDTEFLFRSYHGVTGDEAARAEVIFGNLPAASLKNAAKLKWLQLNSAGADAYLGPGLLPEGCRLTTATGAYGLTVSEHILSMIMSMNRKLPLYWRNQQQSLWRAEGTVRSVEGSTVLILGAGDIGCDFARKAKALGAYTIGIRRNGADKPECLDELHALTELDELLPRADTVVICLPLTAQTRRLFDGPRLARMKPDALLVNIGRGPIVDTDALCAALQAHALGGACLDVTEPEPLPAGHPLWQCDNVMITPHVAGYFYLPETMNRVVAVACENLTRYFAGRPLINQAR